MLGKREAEGYKQRLSEAGFGVLLFCLNGRCRLSVWAPGRGRRLELVSAAEVEAFLREQQPVIRTEGEHAAGL
ncbi:MAG TPA: hypothetical protein VLA19_17255 [Herpetosiphonaceae bacterium]|nr:hypothetical protein [Herpetosiphonaceae bacterium]